MWSGPSPAQFCSEVKLVVVRGATFSKHVTFLQRLHNLEKIILTDMEDKDPCGEIIFVDEGNSGGEIQARKLMISDKDKLMHIGKESSQSAVPVFPKLERLRVQYCSGLKNLDSSTISFQNLTSLTVDDLDGLEYLVSHRIARSLMQLTRLNIRYCKRMEVIVATEEDDDAVHHELAFSRLKHLELRHVPHLRGLCSGNCILMFPSLETLDISKRLKSKLFSHDEMQCTIDYQPWDTDVEDDDDGGDDNEVNDDGHGNDKKDDEDSACDANVC